MPRVLPLNPAFNDRPFEGSGASLYVTVGTRVVYRGLRAMPYARNRRNRCSWIKGRGGRHNLAAASVQKTTRVDAVASPGTEFTYNVPPEYAEQTVSVDVRQYADDVENLTDNYRIATVTFDEDLDDATGITGVATLLETQIRAGGIVRFRFRFDESSEGVQPAQFVAIRTAGPTSPANSTILYATGIDGVFELDTPALSDASPYTYKIRAENGAVLADVLTDIVFTADATGPSAPGSGSAEAV